VTPETSAPIRQAGEPASAAGERIDRPVLSRNRRVGILLICSMSLLIVGLDVTIVNVALPSIGQQLHTSVSGLQWTIDGYTLVLASLLMLSGSIADRFGRKKIFIVGLLVFVTGSLLCSLATDASMLVIFRMMQAVGGSMLNPVAMSIITNTFTDPRERAQAIGVWGAVIGVSMALGPVLGGVLVSSVGWRSVFWINIPIGLVAALLTFRFVPESRAPRIRRFDPAGQILIIALFASLTYGIIESPTSGFSSPVIVAAFAIAAGSLVGLVAWERRSREPLVDMRFFGSLPFAGATVTAVAAFATLGGFLFVNTLYLQEVRGLSPLRAGLDTLPMAAMMMVFSPLSGRIVGSRGARIPMLLAGIAMMSGSALMTGLSNGTSFTLLFVAYVCFGLGFGLVNAPITNAAMAGMPRAQAGVAAGIASTSRQVGQTLGVAVGGALVSTGLASGAAGRAAVHRSLAMSSHAVWWTLFGCGAAVFLLGIVVTTSFALATARRTAESLNPEALAGGQPRSA
jgi:EmrB/QacA subfamily drug resistance transporter